MAKNHSVDTKSIEGLKRENLRLATENARLANQLTPTQTDIDFAYQTPNINPVLLHRISPNPNFHLA